jgi:hypothetical protein
MGVGRGMDDSTIYAGALILGFMAQIALYLITTGKILAELHFAMEELDSKLALAIQNVVKELPFGEMEPVNPIQQIIAQLIQSNMANKADPEMKVMTRDDKGLFTSIKGESET